MKTLAYCGLVGGLAAVAPLVAWRGFATVAGIAASGWGLLLLPIAWLPRMLFAPRRAPRLSPSMRHANSPPPPSPRPAPSASPAGCC